MGGKDGYILGESTDLENYHLSSPSESKTMPAMDSYSLQVNNPSSLLSKHVNMHVGMSVDRQLNAYEAVSRVETVTVTTSASGSRVPRRIKGQPNVHNPLITAPPSLLLSSPLLLSPLRSVTVCRGPGLLPLAAMARPPQRGVVDLLPTFCCIPSPPPRRPSRHPARCTPCKTLFLHAGVAYNG